MLGSQCFYHEHVALRIAEHKFTTKLRALSFGLTHFWSHWLEQFSNSCTQSLTKSLYLLVNFAITQTSKQDGWTLLRGWNANISASTESDLLKIRTNYYFQILVSNFCFFRIEHRAKKSKKRPTVISKTRFLTPTYKVEKYRKAVMLPLLK